MYGNRIKLRLFYLSLCAAQLLVTAMGLAVAYQVQGSYSRDIDYETSVNAEHASINELEVYARVAAPESLDLDDDSGGPAQLSQIEYASKLFLRKAQELLDQSVREANSPLVRSQDDLRAMIQEMGMVERQSRQAGDAWQQHNLPLARARLTYADRSATRVQTILGDINQDMSRAKDEVLARESAEARHARLFLSPLSILGIFLVLPALLYARRLDKNIWTYEARLEKERNLLEERVAERTTELRDEIENRKRMEAFNGGRNHLLEKVAEGKSLDDLLGELASATEQSVPESRCLIVLGGSHARKTIAPNLRLDVAASLENFLFRSWDSTSAENGAGQCAPGQIAMFRDIGPDDGGTPAEAWAKGFRGLFAVPITEPGQPLLGVIALLLADQRKPDDFAREVLLSASRVALVALKHNRIQDELFQQAHYDALTRLPNRVLFEDRLQHAVALAARRKSNVGIVCIDLDGFKQVNDQYGHHAGDWLLQQVAQRLTAGLRKTDTVARLGGDEFVVVVHDTEDGVGVAKVCEALVRSLAEPYCFGGASLRTTASIGAAIFPADGVSCAELRRNADLAMYRAKERGRNTVQMFSSELGKRIERRKQIAGNLQDALDHDGFELYYQPIYTVSRVLAGFEALIRFRRPELKSISPAEFIGVAEQAGQIPRIGEWVLREACRQCKQWQDEGYSSVPVAVNVSVIQLARYSFAELVSRVLGETGLAPKWLHVEITETALMSDFEECKRQLCALSDLGVHISIDDFGTGHSSLSYIHRLPVKSLKIDRSFVKEIVDSSETRAIVRAIVAMSQALGLTVTAEGVETQEQLNGVAIAGCDFAQGYYFARPLDRSAVVALLEREPVRA